MAVHLLYPIFRESGFLCTSNFHPINFVEFTFISVFSVPEGTICETCIESLKYAETILSGDKIKQLFMFALDQVCKATPFPDEVIQYYFSSCIDYMK